MNFDHTEHFSFQNIQVEYFVENFSLSIFYLEVYHMVIRRVTKSKICRTAIN